MYDKNCSGYWHQWLETNKVIPHQESPTGWIWSWDVDGKKKYFFVDESADFHGDYSTYEEAVDQMSIYAKNL